MMNPPTNTVKTLAPTMIHVLISTFSSQVFSASGCAVTVLFVSFGVITSTPEGLLGKLGEDGPL